MWFRSRSCREGGDTPPSPQRRSRHMKRGETWAVAGTVGHRTRLPRDEGCLESEVSDRTIWSIPRSAAIRRRRWVGCAGSCCQRSSTRSVPEATRNRNSWSACCQRRCRRGDAGAGQQPQPQDSNLRFSAISGSCWVHENGARHMLLSELPNFRSARVLQGYPSIVFGLRFIGQTLTCSSCEEH